VKRRAAMGIPPPVGDQILHLGIKLIEETTKEVKSAIEERNRKRVKIGSQTVGDIERLEKQAEEIRAIQDPLGLESEEAMRVFLSRCPAVLKYLDAGRRATAPPSVNVVLDCPECTGTAPLGSKPVKCSVGGHLLRLGSCQRCGYVTVFSGPFYTCAMCQTLVVEGRWGHEPEPIPNVWTYRVVKQRNANKIFQSSFNKLFGLQSHYTMRLKKEE
jgi:hypothetical protein